MSCAWGTYLLMRYVSVNHLFLIAVPVQQWHMSSMETNGMESNTMGFLWNYICVNKNERNFIQTNVTFPETIKNMPLQKKKNTMKT